jgi:hypothetical protein
MGQPIVISEVSRHNGNGHHDMPEDSRMLYEAGFEAGYRQGFEAGLAQARLHTVETVSKPVAAKPSAKHLFLGLPCSTCGAYFYTDEECPRCKPKKA